MPDFIFAQAFQMVAFLRSKVLFKCLVSDALKFNNLNVELDLLLCILCKKKKYTELYLEI